jgi:hypothetical protein
MLPGGMWRGEYHSLLGLRQSQDRGTSISRTTVLVEQEGPVTARLRQALKVLGRRFGLVCLDVAEVTDDAADDSKEGADQGGRPGGRAAAAGAGGPEGQC